MEIAIIGGGASGVICALKIKEFNKNANVTIYEASNKLLKKVSISGNGRCNLGNKDLSPKNYRNQELIKFLEPELKEYVNYFKSLGLFIREDKEGRLYPKTKEATTLVELLTKELFYEHIKVVYDTKIKDIYKRKDKYVIDLKTYDKVVIAIGSNAFLSNDLTHYDLVKNLGLKVVNLKPGLVGFKTKENLKKISGSRSEAKCILGTHTSVGEVMFKDDGVSGICIMDLSIYYQAEKTLILDLINDYSLNDLLAFKKKMLVKDPNLRLYNLAFGLINNKILNYVNQKYENKAVKSLSDEEIILYLKEFKEFKLHILDTYDYKSAQVNRGGVSLNELTNLKLKTDENIYLCGEILDEAGICGGYNLAYCFASGIKVAKMICGVK